MSNIVPLTSMRPIVDANGVMTQEAQAWFQQITDFQSLTGEGSPEGVVEADIGREYIDTIGTASAIKYVKRNADDAGDRSKGWILI